MFQHADMHACNEKLRIYEIHLTSAWNDVLQSTKISLQFGINGRDLPRHIYHLTTSLEFPADLQDKYCMTIVDMFWSVPSQLSDLHLNSKASMYPNTGILLSLFFLFRSLSVNSSNWHTNSGGLFAMNGKNWTKATQLFHTSNWLGWYWALK